jgi:hypothetical protein
MDDRVAFAWPVPDAPYRLVDLDYESPSVMRGTYLTTGVTKEYASFRARWYEPLVQHSGLFREFADLESEETIVRFASSYGALGGQLRQDIFVSPAERADHPVLCDGELLKRWWSEIRAMRDAIQLWEWVRAEDVDSLAGYLAPREIDLNQVPIGALPFEEANKRYPRTLLGSESRLARYARFAPGDVLGPALAAVQDEINIRLEYETAGLLLWDPSERQHTLRIVPRSLRGALWLQLARAVEGNKEFRQCSACQRWFELDPRVARRDRHFCSGTCRTQAYRNRQLQAQQLHEQGVPLNQIASRLVTDVETARGWINRARRGKQRRG